MGMWHKKTWERGGAVIPSTLVNSRETSCRALQYIFWHVQQFKQIWFLWMKNSQPITKQGGLVEQPFTF